MKEKLAVISVLLVLAAVPLAVLYYQQIHRPSLYSERVITITGVGNRGVWTLKTANGLNYWWKSFEPATIHLALGETVVLRFVSADVFHQFYTPALGIGPVDVEPGYVKEVRYRATRAGVFQYYCTSMCGGCHFYMQGWIVVTPPGEKPAKPRPIACSLCLPAFVKTSEADALALGEYLYQSMGCITCHGPGGRGGVANYNYIKKSVPNHDTTAAKLFLTDGDDRRAFLGLIRARADLANPAGPPDISRYRLVMSRFKAAVELIENGKNAARLDLNGPEPPLQMPAWKHKLDRAQIHAIMGYFISLFPEEDDGLTEG
jgi:mono/diheme cytochrome c family protein/plastocyanin